MASDKSQRTERATPKHKKEMRDKGTVARSAELGGWASLLVVTSLFPWLLGNAASRVSSFTQSVTSAMGHPSTDAALAMLASGLATAAFTALPAIALGTALAVVIAFAQVGLRFSPKGFRVDLSRISPRSGLKRVFSSQGLWSLAKTLVKLAMLAVIGLVVVRRLMAGILGASTMPLQSTLGVAATNLLGLLRTIGVLALVLAIGDYAFQRHSYQQSLRMTKQEVKDERRQDDGSPEMRRAMRSRARKISRRQMMAAVATADVVVTNPTHFAVALAYDRAVDRAPRVVAKGADLMALSIREHARANGVVVVENRVLARTLYHSCEVGDVVAPGVYAAVARLLAFVYQLTPTAKVFTDVHVMAG